MRKYGSHKASSHLKKRNFREKSQPIKPIAPAISHRRWPKISGLDINTIFKLKTMISRLEISVHL